MSPAEERRIRRLLSRGATSWMRVHARGRVRSDPDEAANGLLEQVWAIAPDRQAESFWELWLERGETGVRRRVERWLPGDARFVTIRNGDEWLTARRGGYILDRSQPGSNVGLASQADESLFLGPDTVIDTVTLDSTAPGAQAGWATVVVQARPIPHRDAEGVPMPFFTGLNYDYWNGDRYQLAIDAEHGVLLRVSAYREGRWRTEVVVDRLEWDTPISPERFDLHGAI